MLKKKFCWKLWFVQENHIVEWMIEVVSRSERRSSIGGEKTMSHFPFRGSPSNNNNNSSSANNNNQVSCVFLGISVAKKKYIGIEHTCIGIRLSWTWLYRNLFFLNIVSPSRITIRNIYVRILLLNLDNYI